MRCILVFDHLNDIIFSKFDKKFARHIKKLGQQQGLISNDEKETNGGLQINKNILIQLFAPLVTSQHIMSSQFGNSYTSIQCQDGTNVVFDEYMGYLFIQIGSGEISWLKRTLSICICFVQHLCGPDVAELQVNEHRSQLLAHLLDTWASLADRDQSCLVEAVEQLTINPDLNTTVIKTLQDATAKVKTLTDYSRIHALIFVDNKFLSLYSTKDADDLAAADILFLSILTECFWRPSKAIQDAESEENSNEEFFSPQSSPDGSRASGSNHESNGSTNEDEGNMLSELVVLCGNGMFSPHAVHVSKLEDGISLVLLYQISNEVLCGGLHDAFSSMVMLQNIQFVEGADDTIRRSLDICEGGIKRIFDTLKKNKVLGVETNIRQLQTKWEYIRRRFQECLKEKEIVGGLEASCSSVCDSLRQILQITCLDPEVVLKGVEAATIISSQVQTSLKDFTTFLKVKAICNFTLTSKSTLTINKYLEEFPGLVHFLYIDRTNHRLTAPCLDFSSEETNTLTKKKIWSMVDFSRAHVQDGHLALMWKDTTFNYSFYLWFEDYMGSPLKPKVCPTTAVKSLPIPGLLCGDFYKKLTEACFPKQQTNKIRCFELYCVHLGLATSSCVLEQSRRIAATIWEVTGLPTNPIDLL